MENKEEGIVGNKIKDLINKSGKVTNYQKLNIPGLIIILFYFFIIRNQIVELQ